MTILVTRTKVTLPRRRSDLLSRQRLLDLLFELMDYRLIILAAPAGYGKTSLLVDFAYHTDLAVCWYTVDALDRDPARFLAHFIAALANRFPAFGAQSLATLESSLTTKMDLDHLAATIVNEAYETIREHFILILDDFHLVNEQKDITAFISRFTQDVDENCHLVLASRALLALPDMPLMVARSMVGGLSFEELAFQSVEIQELIQQNYNVALPKTEAEEIAFSTEGWVTGLLLSTQTLPNGLLDRMRLTRVSRVRLYDYLAQQVLDQQPAEVRDFLLSTSVLDEFDHSLCESIFGEGGIWRQAYEYVLENNLFVLPVGEDGRWIRYHHLFRDFLQARLDLERPQESGRIRRRLVEIFAEQEDWERAHSICRQLDDPILASELIKQAGTPLVRSSRLALLAEWIDELPEEILVNSPQLLSLRAVPELVFGQPDRSLALLNQAVELFQVIDDPPALARTLARRATALRFLGKYWESLQDASAAQQLIGDSPALQPYQADALRASGVSLYQIGQIQEATGRLSQALAIYQALKDRQNAATVQMELGLAQMSSGQYRSALQYYEQALEYWRKVNNSVRQANLLNYLGVLHHLLGNYIQAVQTLEEALSKARQNRYTRMEAYILASIGDIYADLEASQAALDAYTRSRILARGIDYHFLLLYTDLATASQLRAAGSLDQAERALASAESRVSETSSTMERGLFELETGRLQAARGDLTAAVDWLGKAAGHFEETGQPVETARALLHLAVCEFRAGMESPTRSHLVQALRLANELDSPHVLVVAGCEARDLLEKASRPPDSLHRASELLERVIEFEAGIPALRKGLRPRSPSVPFAPPRLVINALGKAQVERDGQPVSSPEWQNQRKVREIFYFLVSNPQGVTKETIGLHFWPESSAAQLKLQFKNAIYRLRHALGPEIVLFNEDVYWFNRELDYEYDVEEFVAQISQARASEDAQQRVELYRSALSIYKGSYLPEADGAWVDIERQRLRNLYIQAALSLAENQFYLSDYPAALESCQSALAEEPSLEEAHRLAMRIHAARGNRAAVSRQYEQCKLILKSEVNAPPSEQTVALYETLTR